LLLVTAHVKVCHLAYDISKPFVNLFRSILPVAPTECEVLIVCRQHNDKEWKFKEQHAKMWQKILRGQKDTLTPVVSTLRGRAPPSPPLFRRLCSVWDHFELCEAARCHDGREDPTAPAKR